MRVSKKASLVPMMDIAVKSEPASVQQRMQHKTAKPSAKISKAVTETALELISDAFAPTKERYDKIKKHIRAGDLTVAATYEAFGIFEQAIGGRDALMQILQHLPAGSNGEALIQGLVLDPDFLAIARNNKDEEVVRYSLAVLCRRHKLPLNTLVAAFRDAKTAQLAIEALTTLAPHAPEVVEQIADDAKNAWRPCTVCEGRARVPRIGDDGEWILDGDEVATQLCYECRGTGKVWQKHDIQNRKMFLQMTRLLEDNNRKDNAVVVQLQQGLMFQAAEGSFERIVKDVNINVAPTLSTSDDVVEAVPLAVYDASNPPESA